MIKTRKEAHEVIKKLSTEARMLLAEWFCLTHPDWLCGKLKELGVCKGMKGKS